VLTDLIQRNRLSDFDGLSTLRALGLDCDPGCDTLWFLKYLRKACPAIVKMYIDDRIYMLYPGRKREKISRRWVWDEEWMKQGVMR
jgi:hypothetical protein